jgi:hypothetical protein
MKALTCSETPLAAFGTALLLCLLSALPALAAEPKPDFSIKTSNCPGLGLNLLTDPMGL